MTMLADSGNIKRCEICNKKVNKIMFFDTSIKCNDCEYEFQKLSRKLMVEFATAIIKPRNYNYTELKQIILKWKNYRGCMEGIIEERITNGSDKEIIGYLKDYLYDLIYDNTINGQTYSYEDIKKVFQEYYDALENIRSVCILLTIDSSDPFWEEVPSELIQRIDVSKAVVSTKNGVINCKFNLKYAKWFMYEEL